MLTTSTACCASVASVCLVTCLGACRLPRLTEISFSSISTSSQPDIELLAPVLGDMRRQLRQMRRLQLSLDHGDWSHAAPAWQELAAMTQLTALRLAFLQLRPRSVQPDVAQWPP